MTVGELIEELSKFPPDMVVKIEHDNCDGYGLLLQGNAEERWISMRRQNEK